jgi:DNA-binding winged helix-turn-helix (wHTH) protein/serine/threonine protein kinase
MTPKRKLVRIWQFAGCEFDESTRQLHVNGELVDLETKPLEILRQLLLRPREVVSQEELFGTVWTGFSRSESLQKSLFTAVSKLRKALPELDPPVIATVPKYGYRLGVPVVVRLADTGSENTLNLQPGDSVPGRENWRVAEQLPGSSSEVWIAKHVKTQELRVFKFALNAAQLEGLKREMTLSRYFVEALANKDEFVRVLDWNFDTEPFLLESAYGGPNLPKWFDSLGGIDLVPLSTRLAVIASVARSVADAHGLGVLHKDLKPSNILVSAGGASNWQVRVADFGSATIDTAERLLGFEITNLGFSSPVDGAHAGGGTWTYTAPEVRGGGPPTAKADVFALGVMLYQVIVGDLSRQLTLGWEADVPDPLLREDIQLAAAGDPAKRLAGTADLAQRLSSLEERRRIQKVADTDAERALLNERRVMADRARRPWIVAAIFVLLAGVCTSLWLYRRALQQRDLADARNADLVATNDFLAKDLISQSNPFRRSPGAGPVQQETLLDAIKMAAPKIDRRFANAPRIAAQLHETIAMALDARTDFAAAEQQYEFAAQRFRAAEGPLSQNALIAEFRREVTQMRTQMPGYIERARQGLKVQEQIMARLPDISPELQGWQALAETGSLIFGPHPEQGLPLLDSAIRNAKRTPGFNPFLLISLETRFGGIYLGLDQGLNAERAARDAIATIQALEGPDSPEVLQPEMFLEEALYLQGKFPQALQQSKSDYARFSQVLGPENQLTLAVLFMKAMDESSMEDYDDAIRDSLAVYAVQPINSSGKFLQENSLWARASFECHSGRIQPGLDHARRVIEDSSPAATNQPGLLNSAKLTVAECLISEAESSSGNHNIDLVNEAGNLLDNVNVRLVSDMPGERDFEGAVDVAHARIALLRKNPNSAREYALKAVPFVNKPGGDTYEKKVLARIQNSFHE